MDYNLLFEIIKFAVPTLISLYALYYVSTQIGFERKRIDLLEKESARTTQHEKTVKTLQSVIQTIKEYTNSDHYLFGLLGPASDPIVRHMYDKKISQLKLKIIPSELKLSWGLEKDGKRYDPINISSKEELIQNTKDLSFDSIWTTELSYTYHSEPAIIDVKVIASGRTFANMLKLASIPSALKAHKDLIEIYDSEIIEEIENDLENLFSKFYDSLTSEHEFTINSDMTSNAIQILLHNEIVGFDELKRTLALIDGDRYDRLDEIKMGIFEKL